MIKRIAFAVATETFAMFTVIAQTSPHGNIQIACQSCHTTDSWSMRPDASFKHEQTGFVLVGQHKTVECASCHSGLKFEGTSERCTACHTDVHKAELGSNCTRCHTVQSWKISDMLQRHQSTRFPLVGKHATLNCQDCHTGVATNQYLGTPVTCIGCHRADFVATTNPNHSSAGFSTSCMDCHSATALAWDASFNHDLTKFLLTGAHRTVACQLCHQSGSFKTTPTDCYGCHQAQFTSTTSPNHVVGGFATTCQQCHSTTAWQPATFDHSITKFPLTGAHTTTPCQSCHTNGNYQLVYSNCYQCHSSNFAGATNPNHVTGNFSQNCQTCHSTTAWQPATFDHSTTRFPLTGMHTTTPCQSCHTNGNYQLAYAGCYSCHTADYNGTTNPNHASAGFPTTCETCHTTSAWTGATFNHTWFPTSHGNANGVCATCHSNPSNYAVFTCTSCHTQSQTNSNHSGVQGYVYNSTNCYSCHPNGRSG